MTDDRPTPPSRSRDGADRRRAASRPRRSPPRAAAPSRASRGSAAPPEAKASLLYRLLRLVGRFVLFVVFRFRIRTSGQEHLPRGRLLPGRRGASRLDGSVRRHARDPGGAACLVPRQRALDLHLALARAAHPSARRAAAGLARRRRDRPARRVGAGRDRATARVFVQMPEGTVSGPPGPHRPVPHRLGGHRAAHRRTDRAARDGRHRGAVPRPAHGLAGPAADDGRARSPGCGPGAPLPEPGSREELELARTDRRGARRRARARRRGALSRGRSIRRSIRGGCRKRLTWLLLGPAGSTGMPERRRPDLADRRLGLGQPERQRSHASRARYPPPRCSYAESILDLVGDTPLVRIIATDPATSARGPPAAAAREARDAQPGRLGQGPDRAADDRGRRARRPAQAGRHHHRADVGQHRPRPGDRGGAQGLPLHLRDGRQAVGREAGSSCARTAPRSCCARPTSRPSRPRATTRSRRGSPATSRARSSPTSTGTRRTRPPTSGRPARSCGTRPTAGSPTSSRASGPAARSPASARVLKARNPAIQVIGADPEGSVLSGDTARPYLTEGVGEDFFPGTYDAVRRRSLGPGQRPRRVRDGPPAHPRGGDPRRRVVRDGDGRRAARSSASCTRAPTAARRPSSSCSCPTAAGTTCRSSTTTSGCGPTACCATTGAVVRVDDLLRDRHHAGPLPDVVLARTTERVGEAIDDPPAVRHQPAAGLGAARGRRDRGHRRLDQREGPARPGLPRPDDRRADGRRGHGPAAAAGRRRGEPRRGVRAAVGRCRGGHRDRAATARSAS